MSSNEVLFLSQEDVIKAKVFDMDLIISTMEEVFSLHEKKDYILPNKCVLRWGGYRN